MNILKIILPLVVIPFNLILGRGFIKGQVMDGYNLLPLVQANIIVDNTEIGTISDSEGKFVIELSEVGFYSISISYIGYESKIVSDIWVRPNVHDYQNIVLFPEVIELGDVVVTKNYFEQNNLDNYSSVGFSNDQIRRAPGAGGEITRILNSLPSVASVGENRQDIMVRGGGPNENGFLIDNIYLPSISHFNQPDGRSNGPVGLINTELVENIEFYTSGFSPEFGNKLSSFGDIEYREGNSEQIEGNLGLGLGGAGGVIEGPVIRNITMLGSFRMSYLNIISDAINAGGLPSYNDYQGKINYKPSQYHNFTILAIKGNSLYDRNPTDAENNEEDNYGSIKNNKSTIGLNHRLIWNEMGYSKTSLSFSKQISKLEFFDLFSDSILNRNNDLYQTFHFRNVNHIRLNKKINTTSGFEFQSRNLNYDFYLNNIFLEDDIAYENISTFININSIIRENTNIAFGVRLEKNSFENKINSSPRLNIDYELPNEFGNIILSAGSYYQNPPEKYLGLVNNRGLKSVQAKQLSLSFEKLLTESSKLSISVYDKNYSNAPVVENEPNPFIIPAFLMDRNITFENIISNGQANSYGIEILVEKKRAENFYGHIGGSLFNSTFIDYLGQKRDRDSNYKYIFNMVGGYRPNNKWELSLRWSFFGGKPYTEVDTATSLNLNEVVYFTDSFNEKRTPVYHNLFLRYEFRKVYKSFNVVSYLEFWNAYNRKNVETYIWSNANKKILEVTYFSFIPVGGFEIEF